MAEGLTGEAKSVFMDALWLFVGAYAASLLKRHVVKRFLGDKYAAEATAVVSIVGAYFFRNYKYVDKILMGAAVWSTVEVMDKYLGGYLDSALGNKE